MSNQVKATTDYGMFKTVEGNREVNNSHVRRLVRVIKENNLMEKFPIVVNSKMEVVDGQHRLAALEKLELPVHYRIEDGVPIEDIRALNQVTRRWSWIDMAKSYVELGNDSYQLIIDLNSERPGLFGLDTLAKLANINAARGNTRPLPNYFFGGGLTLDEEQREQLQRRASQLGDLADTQPHFKGITNGRELPSSYATAMARIMQSDDYNHPTFMQRVMNSHTVLPQVVDVNEALRELEKAYNKNLGEDKRVRLF